MFWFKHNESHQDEHAHDGRVEVVVNKKATQEAAADAKDATRKLNRLLIDNGFTLNIYLAAHNPRSLKKGSK